MMLSHFGSIGSEFDPERTFLDLDQLRGAAFRVAGMKVLELTDSGPCNSAHSKEPHFSAVLSPALLARTAAHSPSQRSIAA